MENHRTNNSILRPYSRNNNSLSTPNPQTLPPSWELVGSQDISVDLLHHKDIKHIFHKNPVNGVSNEYAIELDEIDDGDKLDLNSIDNSIETDLESQSDSASNLNRCEINQTRFIEKKPSRFHKWVLSWPDWMQSIIYKNAGLKLIALSQLFGSGMNVCTRILETNYHPPFNAMQILFVRMTFTTAASLLYMYFTNVPNFILGPKGVRLLLLSRGIFGFIGVFGLYYSLEYLSLSDSVVITFLLPVLAGASCFIFLKEKFTIREVIAGFVALFGVIIIARPAFLLGHISSQNDTHGVVHTTRDIQSQPEVSSGQRLLATLIALCGVVGGALAFTSIRAIGMRAHPLMSVNYFAMTSAVISFFAILFIPNVKFLFPSDSLQWLLLALVGICGFTLQFLITAGLQRERAGRGFNMTYLQMFFALAFDKLIWGITPDLLSIAGSTLILGSAIWVAMSTNNTQAKPNENQEENINDFEGNRNETDDAEITRGFLGEGIEIPKNKIDQAAILETE